MKNKTLILAIFVLGVVTFSSAQTWQGQADSNQQAQITSAKPKSPEYVPGEVLVKFKEGVDPQAVLGSANFKAQSLSRIHSIAPAVAKLKKTQSLEKDSEGWYWFLGKRYKEVDAIPDEELFAQAYTQMLPEEKSLFRVYKVVLASGMSVGKAVDFLRSLPEVEYAEPNRIYHTNAIPNDPLYHSRGSWEQDYDDLWGLKLIEADKAWDVSEGDGVVVAVIDSGVDYFHEDLTEDANGNGKLDAGEDQNGNGVLDSNIWRNKKEIPNNGKDDDNNGYIDDVYGYNFYANSADPFDDNGHGSHVAGIIAALKNNGKGIIGVAPKVKIMPVKGLSQKGGGTDEMLAAALKYAADNQAKVLSNSWGGDGALSFTLKQEIDYAHNLKKCVLVFAAGNDSDDVAYYSPAGYRNVITVAASDPQDQKCDSSNYGAGIDVSAPGGGNASDDGPDGPDTWKMGRNILSLRASRTDMYGDIDPYRGLPKGICLVPGFNENALYYRSRGTSMACPFVSGVAALVLAQHPDYTPEQVRAAICLAADDRGEPGKDDSFGYGRANAQNAASLGTLYCLIDYPSTGEFIRGKVAIRGGAFVENGILQGYELSYAPQDNPQEKKNIVNGSQPISNGILVNWDTSSVPDGRYILEFTLRCKLYLKNQYVEKTYSSDVGVIVDNVNSPAQLTIKSALPGFSSYYTHTPNVDQRILLVPGQMGQGSYELAVNDELDDASYWGGKAQVSLENLPEYWDYNYNPATQKGRLKCLFNRFLNTQKLVFTINDGNQRTKKEVYVSWVAIDKKALADVPVSVMATNNRVFWKVEGKLNMFDAASQERKEFALPSGTKINYLGRDEIAAWDDFFAVAVSDEADTRGLYSPRLYLYQISRPQDAPRLIFSSGPDTWNSNLSFDNGIIAWENSYSNNDNPANSYAHVMTFNASNNTSDVIFSVQGETAGLGLSPYFNQGKLIFVQPDIERRVLTLFEQGKMTPLTTLTNPYSSIPIRAHNNKIVYQDLHDLYKTNEIYLYDILTKQKIKLTNNWVVYEWEPDIYNDKIVWFDDMPLDFFKAAEGHNIWLYDYTNNQAIRLVVDEFLEVVPYPSIFKNTVFYRKTTPFDIGGHGLMMACFWYSPMIESVSPENAGSGQQITIKGRDFGEVQENSLVQFIGGAAAQVTAWSDTLITCIVPENIGSGECKVIISLSGVGGLESNPVLVATFSCSLRINNGVFFANSPKVTLSLQAKDVVTNRPAKKVRISNYSFAFDGTVLPPWMPSPFTEYDFKPNIPWTLANNYGRQTVYARFQDEAGNWSPVYSASITLETVPPIISFTPLPAQTRVKPIVFNVVITDADSGIKQALLYYYDAFLPRRGRPRYKEIKMQALVNNTYRASIDRAELRKSRTTLYYYIAAQDNAGNWQSTPEYRLEVR